MGCLGDGVLLEGSVNSIAGELGLSTKWLVHVLTIGAAETGAIQPLDAGVITNLDILDELATSNDDTSTFMAADKRQFGGNGPVAQHSVKVGMAYARVLDVDENLIRPGLCHGDLLVHDGYMRKENESAKCVLY